MKKYYTISITCLLLALISYPLTIVVAPHFCDKNTLNNCSLSYGLTTSFVIGVIMAVLIMLSITFAILGFIKNAKSKK